MYIIKYSRKNSVLFCNKLYISKIPQENNFMNTQETQNESNGIFYDSWQLILDSI